MSQSKTKKVRKEVRRKIDAELGKGLEALSKIVRPRPRWIPKRVWILVYLPLFPKTYLPSIYRHLK